LHLNNGLVELSMEVLLWVFFCLLMRLSPLAGTHGAEHMVVHAIEREEDLDPNIVSRMPRVHPRCGTNLVAGLTIFTSILFSNWYPDEYVRLLVAIVATVSLWRVVGSVFQQFITTKTPSRKQLEDGVEAGEMVLERYANSPISYPNVGLRLWNSGIFHVLVGSTLFILAAAAIAQILGVDPLILGIDLGFKVF
jgi:uncharacterized protein YqhQ